MALAYSEFGLVSPSLYAAYLSTFFNGECSRAVAEWSGVHGGVVGCSTCDTGRGESGRCDAFSDVEAVRAFGALCVNTKKWQSGFVGRCDASGRNGESVGESSTAGSGDKLSSRGPSTDQGEVPSSECGIGTNNAGVECSGGSSGVGVESRGKHYKKNKAKKLKKSGRRSGVAEASGSDLQGSLERKWAAENALAEEKAKQQLELLQARDLENVKRMQRAQVLRTTEVCKVQTEKAFGTLKRTGNVPGFAETVVSEPSLTDGSTARSNGECISPDSSVSQQEIRKMQQDLLEYEKKEADYKHMLRKVKEANPLLYDHVVRIGPLKTAFTLESDGGIPVEEFGEVREDGKFHVAYPSADIITNKERAKLEALGELHFPGGDDHEYLLGQAGAF